MNNGELGIGSMYLHNNHLMGISSDSLPSLFQGERNNHSHSTRWGSCSRLASTYEYFIRLRMRWNFMASSSCSVLGRPRGMLTRL